MRISIPYIEEPTLLTLEKEPLGELGKLETNREYEIIRGLQTQKSCTLRRNGERNLSAGGWQVT